MRRLSRADRQVPVRIAQSNIRELIANRQPLPHVEGDPRSPDLQRLVKGEFGTVDGVFLERPLRDGDLVQFFYNTGGGYGDPIERDPAAVQIDLDKGIQSIEIAAKVYGVVANLDSASKLHSVDDEATRKTRDQCRRDRAARAVPVKDWMAGQRDRLLSQNLVREVKEMYNDVFGISQRWGREFREFWKLPEDFTFKA